MRSKSAFTLLEIMISVMLISLVALGIYRCVELNLSAIRMSTDTETRDNMLRGVTAFIQAQLNNLPRSKSGAFMGKAQKFNNLAADEMEWVCRAGNGLLTRHAEGEYKVVFKLVPVSERRVTQMGILRTPLVGTDADSTWWPLAEDIDALEIRYFDVRLNAWIDRWTDPGFRPTAVRVRFWRKGEEIPFEKVLSLPPVKIPTN